MPSIKDHPSRSSTKLIVLGHSGTGKTGALMALANAGYNVRILDFDNGTDILKDLSSPQSERFSKIYSADCADRIHYMTLTEKMQTAGGKIFPITAQAFSQACDILDGRKSWGEGTSFGAVKTWGPQDVLVIDTTTGLGGAAFNHVLGMQGKLMNQPTGNERRRAIGAAQELCDDLFEMLASDEIKCNVVLNAHINYQDEPGTVRRDENEVVDQRGFMTVLGRAIGPKVPRRYNSLVQIKKIGLMRKIVTETTDNVDLKVSAPSRVKREYPLETGLAELFADLRGEAPPAPPKP